ncbi:MAG: hypothetical protein AB7F88_17860 [Pyrinomonadaceae bacterium]
MKQAILSTMIFALILAATTFAQQEPSMKRQGPTMTSTPAMKATMKPTMKKSTPAVKKKSKGAKKRNTKRTTKRPRRTR